MIWLLLTACMLREPADVDVIEAAPIETSVWDGLVQKREIVSKPYHIDAIYPSMRGPSGFDYATLLEVEKPELVWIVGYQTEVVESKNLGAMSQEYLCHANLDFDAKIHYKHFPDSPPISGRVFTLSQGQAQIHFPPGMGIPVRSDLQFSLATQVLNLNIQDPDLTVNHKVNIEFVRDSDLDAYRAKHPDWEMTPLYQTAVQGFKALENARYYGVKHDDADAAELGEGCSVGSSAIDGDIDEDALGQKFTAHWVVPPGKEVNRTNVTRFLNLPFDTTAYYIATHLHPFARTLTLNDLTTGKQVYQSTAKNSTGRIGLDSVDVYSSYEGIKLQKEHEYELVSVYDNTSGHDVDSMAVLYLYAHDRRFDRAATLERIAAAKKEEPAEQASPEPSM